ncbi:helix-turn-helix domain-containing protein [Bradyrhizobium sp. SSUT18]|uniref:AraC-like ligand-binding domain-containing protein n=1 Tax=unclassified Bradyrhizobium TaxID=2631580 RepID=UPI00244D65AB|nr:MULTISPECIES: helix-turn-helix domain-containing protein [unclassified Bradyrhizobium]MDH2345656.1 helix-turn-helix domain-containing protein [Bradyrhizobium sp. SSUT77]MDH2399320.1 helix-turn-helix domain-containing protein [Bradyrhizobium sp. SSUT18]
MPIQFTTDDSPGYRRLALWQDIVCDVFVGLDCKSDLGSAFHGSVTQAALGKAVCSEVCSDRQHVFRTPSRISRSDQDFVLIALGNRGAGGVVQDGRETVIHPGEFALYDTTRPYELKFNDTFTQTIFKVPRDMVRRRLGGTEALTAMSFGADVPLERLAYDFIFKLCQSADRLAPNNAAALSEQAVDLLTLALSERLGTTSLPSSTHRSALLYRLKAHIRVHLADPDLSLSETAAALGISSRYVNDLLADENTSFQRYVLGERLAQCRRDLASPVLAHRHISEIAFAWGFNDLSHFGRVFREHFGMSPRDFRQSQSRH